MDKSSVKEPNHRPTAIWISAMMSCVRALTSRSVFSFGLQKRNKMLKIQVFPLSLCLYNIFSLRQQWIIPQLFLTVTLQKSDATSLISLPCCCSSPQHFLTVGAACSHNCSVKRAILSLCASILVSVHFNDNRTERGPDEHGLARPTAMIDKKLSS